MINELQQCYTLKPECCDQKYPNMYNILYINIISIITLLIAPIGIRRYGSWYV